MFARESEMAASVARWLARQGLLVKPEFVTPWGICDLVGVRLNKQRIAQRLHLKQRKPISSITRAAILLQVPEIETSSAISLDGLVENLGSAVSPSVIAKEIARLVSERYVIQSDHGDFQKVNGWMPLQERLVAVELKLARVEEALQQAKNNLGFAQESFVAFPFQVARRIASSKQNWIDHFGEGIGLIGVRESRCDVLVPAVQSTKFINQAIQLYSVEKFWRIRGHSQRQDITRDSATASGRFAVPSPSSGGRVLPSA